MTFFAKNFVSLENWGEILEKKEMRNCVRWLKALEIIIIIRIET